MITSPNLVFDFDGTIVGPESLPLLASIALLDHPERESIVEEIEHITQMGMNNEISFEESLSLRLGLMKPSRQHIDAAIQALHTEVSPTMRDRQDYIRENSENIYIVSGGFREIIVPVVQDLGIDPGHIFANSFLFDDEGYVTGCDTENPLSHSGGKAELIRSLGLQGEIVMIGDGYSDYEVFEKGVAHKIVISTEFVPPRDFVNGHTPQAKNFDEVLAYLHPRPILERA